MKTAGLWLHAWDFESEGLEAVLAWARDSGLTTLYPASTYHSGWFIHPHAHGRRAWMPEDGTVYFHPDPATWQGCRLRPTVARVAAATDWFAAAGAAAPRYGLDLAAWTVCCHNTALGLRHPEVTVRNCFGDSYPHALNPSHPDVRAYLAALVRNLATGYPLRAVQLEAPCYQGFRHGHHHERHSVALDAVAQRLFDLSFADSDLAMAQAAGINADQLRRLVAGKLQAYFDLAPDRPADWPASYEALLEEVPCLRRYQAAQNAIVEGLRETCLQALEGTACRLEGFGFGSQYHILTFGCYGASPDVVAQRVVDFRGRMDPGQELQIGLRVGFGDVASAGALRELVAACADSGADGVLFYNYSEMSRANLSWIRPALDGYVNR